MSDYYYPDTVAEFKDYSTEWDCDPEYDYVDDNPVDLIDDIKEEDFIKSEEEFVKNLSTWMTREEALCTMYNNLMRKLEHIENLLTNKKDNK